MTVPMDCRIGGRWRIVEADLWDRDYLDLVVPAAMTIGADGHGEIAYGAMQASLDLGLIQRTMAFLADTKLLLGAAEANVAREEANRSQVDPADLVDEIAQLLGRVAATVPAKLEAAQ